MCIRDRRVMTDKLGDWFDAHPNEAKNIIHIGYWRVNEPAAESGSTDDAALAIE